jgi:hypothetical protein
MQNATKFQNRAITAATVSVLILASIIIIPYSNTSAQSFSIKYFKITNFGIKNHNPFVVVQGKAGGTRCDESGDNEFGYVFDTDKGLFGAFSAFPNQPYISSHFTQKNVNGQTCLDKSQTTGHVAISRHKLTIIGINIKNVKKVWTELSFTDTSNGNCINRIYSSKTNPSHLVSTASIKSTSSNSTSTTGASSKSHLAESTTDNKNPSLIQNQSSSINIQPSQKLQQQPIQQSKEDSISTTNSSNLSTNK